MGIRAIATKEVVGTISIDTEYHLYMSNSNLPTYLFRDDKNRLRSVEKVNFFIYFKLLKEK